MSPPLQTRLLRVLAEGEFYRVGGQTPVRVDVRVIAATHQDLESARRGGRFREDLLHRLNVMRIDVPPLRQRREDIPELLQHYLDVAAIELGVAPKTLTPEADAALVAFDWPGNVRQLVNACRRLTVTAAGREITRGDIPADLGGAATRRARPADWSSALAAGPRRSSRPAAPPLLEDALPEFERTLIREALRPRAADARMRRSCSAGAATRSRASSRNSGWTKGLSPSGDCTRKRDCPLFNGPSLRRRRMPPSARLHV